MTFVQQTLTVFLRSTDGPHAGHDGLAVGVTRRHEGFSENALGIAAHLLGSLIGTFEGLF